MRPNAMTTPADDHPIPPAPAGDAPTGEAPSAGASWRRLVPRRRPGPEVATSVDVSSPGDGGEPGEEMTTAIPTAPRPERPGTLRRRRRALIGERQDAVYHLGGLAFELYRRDMLTEEVMRRRAGDVAALDDSVRDIDTLLGELDRERRERRVRSEDDPTAGCCVRCRASFRADARFCSNCGAALVPPSHGDEQPTAAIAPLA